jgi:predicted Kef-type K+ transport protein
VDFLLIWVPLSGSVLGENCMPENRSYIDSLKIFRAIFFVSVGMLIDRVCSASMRIIWCVVVRSLEKTLIVLWRFNRGQRGKLPLPPE